MNHFFFAVYPYICLVILTLGLIFRYMATPGEWNARSSNLFAKKSLFVGSYLFHYAIIITFFGHVGGLLIPPAFMDIFGFTPAVHFAVAGIMGKILSVCVFAGLCILLFRHYASPDVRATTVPMDIVVILCILFQSVTGGWQDYVTRTPVFLPVGLWIRGVLACQPDPAIMANAPIAIKMHVVCGFAIFAMIPFSRLVHFFSIPLTWCWRPLIAYRRRYENI